MKNLFYILVLAIFASNISVHASNGQPDLFKECIERYDAERATSAVTTKDDDDDDLSDFDDDDADDLLGF